MFFHVYGAHALLQWGMMLVVLAGLILWNEFARRTKTGGIITFFAIPVILTAYFVAIAIGARTGAEWALNNQTHLYMNGWFHYAKLSSWPSISSSPSPPTSNPPSKAGTAGGSAAKESGSMAAGTMS